MRELTFTGFLTKYVRSLSESDTNSIRVLAREALEENPRLREPLFLYALYTGKQDLLLKEAKNTGLDIVYGNLFAEHNCETMEAALQKGGVLPPEYDKVWRSFQSRKARPETDNATKALMRNKILALQAESGISNYRIYTDLGINPGNMNAWLKHGDHDKVSLNTARETLAYMKAKTKETPKS